MRAEMKKIIEELSPKLHTRRGQVLRKFIKTLKDGLFLHHLKCYNP